MSFQFHHVHLICSDLEKMIRFFKEKFGAKLTERKKFGSAEGAKLDLNGTSIYIRIERENDNIIKDPSASTYGYNHIGFMVEDLNAAYQELSQKGCVFPVPPNNAGDHPIAFLKGPDNISIELLQA